MKKIYSSVLLAVTLLLSTNIWAANVAKVTNTVGGTPVGENNGEYATMAEALAVWTDGTTLTMLDNATYTAPLDATYHGTYNVEGTRTLDLAGYTLTWDAASSATGKNNGTYIEKAICVGDNASLSITGIAGSVLNFSCKNGQNHSYAIYAGIAAKKLSIGAVSINVNFDANGMTSKEPYAIYCVNKTNCELSIIGTTINISGYARGALYIGSKENENTEPMLSKITITGQNLGKEEMYGICAYRDAKLENCVISLAGVSSAIKCHGLYSKQGTNLTISGADTRFAVNENLGSTAINYFNVSNETLTIENGVFIAPIAMSVGSDKFTFKTNISADAKFSSQPWAYAAPEGKMFAKVGGDGEYNDYWCVTDGAYRFTDGKLGYMSATECLNVIQDNYKYSKFIVLTATEQNDFEIPQNKIINLYEKADKMYNGTITNRGTISFKGTRQWDNTKVINYGTITLDNADAYYLDGFVLENKEGGTVTVTAGYFTEKSLNQVKSFLTNKYLTEKSGNYWKVFDGSEIVARVGETNYKKLADALKNSSAENPAKLVRDFNAKGGAKSLVLGDGVDGYLNLNTYTLTLPIFYGVELQNAHLTISNGTLNCTQSSAVDLIGSSDPNATNYTTLTINSDVEVKQSEGEEYFVSISEDNVKQGKFYGVVVNFNGTYKGEVPFYIHADLTTISDNAPTFNIGKDAKITANSLAYAAGYGIWNYEGTATTSHHGFELRAGKLNVKGGKIVCTSDAPADDQGNGNGSTSQASAIAACQHGTKLPVEINISGGEFEAYTPLYQANTEKNPQEAYDKVKVTVTGGKFKATKGSKNVVWSENKKIALEGGVYNMNPSAYAANGKVAVANTDETTKADYPWMIDNVKAGITFQTAGEWNTAANWLGNVVATGETPVTIAANVTITGKAEAYGITVEADKNITIKKGGVLVVGKNGIAGITSADQLIIEDGGALVISPAATTNNQPLATVKKVLNIGKMQKYDEGESPYMRRHIGIPTLTQPTIVKNIAMGAREWDVMNGWQDATDILAKPFKGYAVTTSAQEVADVDIAFKGYLIGNEDVELAMYRDGFFFFANSWVAPIDASEVLNQLKRLKNEDKVEANITVFVPEEIKMGGDIINSGTFFPITENVLGKSEYAQYWGTIAPLSGFFLHANAKTAVSLNYEKAAWNVQLAKKSAAPKRMMAAEEETNAVRIKLIAANGRQDKVYLYDGEEFHATKMMNTKPNVNIFVETAEGNYAEFASEDLEGTVIGIQTNSQTNYSLSFDWLKGETLYIKDLQTGVVTAMTEGNVYNFVATANETSHRFIISRHNAPTAIDEVMVNTAVKGVYSITGQYLGESSVLETLPQGIYVVDGQKYIK